MNSVLGCTVKESIKRKNLTMLDVLDRKIRQMHQALGDLANEDLSQLKTEYSETDYGFYQKLDFNQGQSDAQLANTATLLIANIASIKDHLKAWCVQNNNSFEGDRLIDSNIDVATIHDLWNIDKHANLNRPPRSGQTPKLINISQQLSLSTGTGGSSSASFSMDPRTGEMKVQTTGSGSVSLVIDAEIVNENNANIGRFAETCERATSAWENALVTAGVPVPSRQ